MLCSDVQIVVFSADKVKPFYNKKSSFFLQKLWTFLIVRQRKGFRKFSILVNYGVLEKKTEKRLTFNHISEVNLFVGKINETLMCV